MILENFITKTQTLQDLENYNDFDIDFYKYVSDSLSQEEIKLSRFFIKELATEQLIQIISL